MSVVVVVGRAAVSLCQRRCADIGAMPALSWCGCGEVSLGRIHIIHNRERMFVWSTVCVSCARGRFAFLGAASCFIA